MTDTIDMIDPDNIRKGFTFTHPTFLDMKWTPGNGGSWDDVIHAECVVTFTTDREVFYGYATDGPVVSFASVSRDKFAAMLNEVGDRG